MRPSVSTANKKAPSKLKKHVLQGRAETKEQGPCGGHNLHRDLRALEATVNNGHGALAVFVEGTLFELI